MFLLIISIAQAELIYKANQEIDIKIPCFNNATYCSAAARCNLTANYPNSTIFINNLDMTNQGSYHNYTIDKINTGILGTYYSSMICDDGGILGKSTFDFKITGNGKEDASGIVVVLFIICFTILLFYLVYVLLYGIGAFAHFDFDIMDLSYNLGGYMAFFGLVMFERFYLGNLEMESLLDIFIGVGAITNCLVPFLMFGISMIKQLMDNKRSKMS